MDILKHLSGAASRSPDPAVRNAQRHPNILGYIDSWEEDETLYIQTELCDLGNFSHFLWEYGRAFPRLDEARVWKIMAELAAGLRFIHDANVIHLDLKPANIFLTGEGRLKIGDFGMASVWPRPAPPGEVQLIPGAKPAGFEREGDKLYLAPEVLQGRYGKAADVFSLGMTMLETASNIVVPDQCVSVSPTWWLHIADVHMRFALQGRSMASTSARGLLSSRAGSKPGALGPAEEHDARGACVAHRDFARRHSPSGHTCAALHGAHAGAVRPSVRRLAAWSSPRWLLGRDPRRRTAERIRR